MANWNEVLGWTKEQLDELRYVGFAYLKQGKFDIALPIYEALTLLDPESSYDLQTLGGLYLETGNNLKALSIIERALKFDPANELSLLNRMKALFALGYRRQAIAQAKELQNHANPEISNQVNALLLAYS
jgi:tetratricopeptide (TPR) repeat protein